MMFSVSHTCLEVSRGRKRHGLPCTHQIVSNITPFPPSHARIYILRLHLLCDRAQCRFAALTVYLGLPFPFAGFISMRILIIVFPIPLIPPKLTGIYFRREKVCFETIFKLYYACIFLVLQISFVHGLVITGGFQHKIRDFHVFGSLRYIQVPPTRNILKY